MGWRERQSNHGHDWITAFLREWHDLLGRGDCVVRSSQVKPPLERLIHTLAITKSGFLAISQYPRLLRALDILFISLPLLCLTFCVFLFASFQYLTPNRIRVFPRDLTGTPLSRPTALHFICSPTRAAIIMSQAAEVESWSPVSIYEPVPVRTVSSDH